MAKFILDGAEINEIKRWLPYISGITTNPILLGKAGTTAQELYGSLVKLGANENFLFFVQVINRDNLIHKSTVGPKMIYKVPLVLKQYQYIKTLKSKGLKVCGTMTYDLIQLQTAIDLGVNYNIVLYHKNKEIDFVWNAVELRDKLKSKVKLIGASYRTKDEVIETIQAGVDYVTVPPNILEECFFNEQASEDYDNLYT